MSATTPGPSDGPSPASACPYAVLGLALVVDQLGKGARMVFRYPTSPPPTTTTATSFSSASTMSNSAGGSAGTAATDDLFFRLPSRQMAKLFRPKPALCGQPMTLTVGGTVFICCSTLMDQPQPQSQSAQQDEEATATATASTATTLTTTTATNSAPAIQTASSSEDRIVTNEDVDATAAADKSNLVLFSVIVALVAPPSSTAATPSGPLSSWVERASNGTQRHRSTASEGRHKASESFLCIRRVHVSLARLCRVLAREERRCRYVSLQAETFQATRSQLQKRWKEQQQHHQQQQQQKTGAAHLTVPAGNKAGGSSTALSGALNLSSPGPMMNNSLSSNMAATSEPRKRGHRKASSFGHGGDMTAASIAEVSGSMTTQAGDDIILEVEQEVVEVIMASRPIGDSVDVANGSGSGSGGGSAGMRQWHARSHRGNLARELAQVFHALGRNSDRDFAPSPSELLTGKSGVVYVNRHIAVPIEPLAEFRIGGAAGENRPRSIDDSHDGTATLRPYHTLLFPLASPAQLLEALQMTSGSADFMRLQQLLMVAAPQKDLKEISIDANLPLPKTIELANYLISQGACVASPVLSRTTRLVCCGVDRIRDAALPFSQSFGPSVNLFLLVSFLAQSGRTLGESMQELATPTTSDARHVALLREGLESSLDAHFHMFGRNARPPSAINRTDAAAGGARPMPAPMLVTPAGISAGQPRSPTSLYEDPVPVQASEHFSDEHATEQMEDMLFQMAAWLRSRHVLNHLVEFLVACLPLAGRRNVRGGAAGSGDGDDVANNVGRRTRSHADRGSGSNDSGGEASEKKSDSATPRRDGIRRGNDPAADDDTLFQELFESGCLQGHSSLAFCCYRLGLESASRLRAFAIRHPRIRIVVREPTERDDW
jgi:hypothetical protein